MDRESINRVSKDGGKVISFWSEVVTVAIKDHTYSFFSKMIILDQGWPLLVFEGRCPAFYPTIITLTSSDWLNTPDPGRAGIVGKEAEQWPTMTRVGPP